MGFVGMGFGAAGSYRPNAVTFDGTNDYLEKATAFTGAASGKEFTLAFWVNNFTDGTIFDIGLDHINNYLTIEKWVGDLRLNARTGGTTVIAPSTIPLPGTSGWQHVYISVNMADTGNRDIYVDGADASPAWGSYINLNLPLNNPPEIGSQNGGGTKLDADLAEVWFDQQYLPAATYASKFITAGGTPKPLGASGERVTGSSPRLFLSGDTANWHTNKGTGDGLSENGALTTAASFP